MGEEDAQHPEGASLADTALQPRAFAAKIGEGCEAPGRRPDEK
jgi:hypothetical protein